MFCTLTYGRRCLAKPHLKTRLRNFPRLAVEGLHRSGTDLIHSFVRRSRRHGEVGIRSIANVDHADLVILAVETAEGRLVVPLKIMDADQFRNRRGLFHVAIGVASLRWVATARIP